MTVKMQGVKTIKKFSKGPGRNGAFAAKYDWDLLLDGEIREITRGVTYTRDDDQMIGTVKQEGRKRGLHVATVKTDKGIELQATPADEATIARWQEQFAAAKARNKEKAAAKRAEANGHAE